MAKAQKKRQPYRMNLEMSQSGRNRLEVLADKTDSTMSEVVRRSLAVYALLLEEIEAGGKVIIRNDDGDREVIIIP